MDCPVCCETMKKNVTCTFCDYTACYKCFSKFMIECTVQPRCINPKCDKPWTRKALVDAFGQYFVTHKYKEKRENVLFDLEKALLPETLPYATREKKFRELRREENKIQNHIRQEYEILRGVQIPIEESDVENYISKRREIKMKIHSLNEDLEGIHIRRTYVQNKTIDVKSSSLFVKCPFDGCRGYVSSNMKCEMCSSKLCRKCHAIGEHECKQEDIDTVKALFSNTKNCPSCKVLIYKIEGCDQMYCTQCHTAFSWRTGEIVHGRIHNPHYYEYMRRNGFQQREIGDIPCGGLPSLRRIVEMYTYRSVVYDIHRLCTHVQAVEIHNDDAIHDNRNLRIGYLLGDLSLENFKHEIQKKEKSVQKKREISTILNTFIVVSSDIFRRIMETRSDEESIKNEFNSIRLYTNELLRDVSRVFGCVVPQISEYWEVTKERFKNG